MANVLKGADPVDVRRVGKTHLSYYITIPARFVAAMGLEKGDFVEVRLIGSSFLTRPIQRNLYKKPTVPDVE